MPVTVPPSFPASQDTQDRQQQAYTAGYLIVGNNVHETQVVLARPVVVAMLHGQMPQADQLKYNDILSPHTSRTCTTATFITHA
jgi:hypothetical protein